MMGISSTKKAMIVEWLEIFVLLISFLAEECFMIVISQLWEQIEMRSYLRSEPSNAPS